VKPEWFPDWSDKAVAIVASGPSAKKEDFEQLRGRAAVLAVKQNVELVPWADVVYGCDSAWWRHKKGLVEFKGLKVSWAPRAVEKYPDIRKVDIETSQDRIYPVEKRSYRMVFDKPGTLGNGGNSGYQALNLAVQFGAKKILLIGFDMHDRSGVHWYGRNHWEKAGNPDKDCFVRWLKAFEVAARDLEDLGVHVINTSPISTLTCFRRGTIKGALAGWGL
jgi:hypothetical protein